MIRGVLAAILAIGVLAIAAPAQAEDSMRCGTRLASTGDFKYKVRSLCGQPSDISLVRVVPRYQQYYDPYHYYYIGSYWNDVPVEMWIYNQGPNKLLRKLLFVGEELVEITTEGYGF
jgi:hypothetical protein